MSGVTENRAGKSFTLVRTIKSGEGMDSLTTIRTLERLSEISSSRC